MSTTGKYYRQGIPYSDENARNLPARIQQEPYSNMEMNSNLQTEFFNDHHGKIAESDDDFLEVWTSIEESIRNFEKTCKTKQRTVR